MVDTAPVRTDLWQVLAGRAVGTPLAPDDPDVWDHVATRLNVAKASPRLRDGIEAVAQITVRGQPYVMLRSPDREASYVRLAPEEWALAQQMDGSRSVAVLVGVLARATGSLAPDRVTRVVADLAANRMLDELPVDAFGGVRRIRGGKRRRRLGKRFLDAARGKRMVLGDVDHAMGVLYRAGGRFLFTKPAAVIASVLALVGVVLFLRMWAAGAESLFLQEGSYAAGGLILLALNGVALLAHELGHALATKHAGRRVPAVGVLLYFGIPSAFVDTTDIWMASRKHRLIATAAGPASALTLAGVAQVTALIAPDLAPLAFKLSFAWYLNAMFNLNPLMALDGYYLAMDALEISNLRSRGIAFLVTTVRTRRLRWSTLDRESRYVAAYGLAAALWTVIFFCLSTRIWRDRVSGLVAGAWHTGIGGKLLVLGFVGGLFAPMLSALGGSVSRRWQRRRALHESTRRVTARLDALRASRLAALPAPVLDALATSASWSILPGGRPLLAAGVLPSAVLVVAAGAAEGRRPNDPPATVRLRVGGGDVLGVAEVLASRTTSLDWRTTADTRVLAVPAAIFTEAAGELLAPPGVDRDAAEAALDASPLLALLPPTIRLELMSTMASVDVPPGKVVTLSDPAHAVLVGSGVLVVDALEHRAGDVIQARSDTEPARATTRTRSTLWRLPGFGSLSLAAAASASAAPPVGVHGGGGHPPVTPPPTPTPGGDDEADDRLWRRTRYVLLLLLLLALLSGGAALSDATPWAEVRGDRVLVLVTRGHSDVVLDGSPLRLGRGSRIALGPGDRVEVDRRSTVHLVYAGGSEQVLCGGTHAAILAVSRSRTDDRDWLASGSLRLERGALLADTEPQTGAYEPLALRVSTSRLEVAAGGDVARFGMTTGRVDVATGTVDVDGAVASTRVVDCAGLSGGGGDDGDDPVVLPSASTSASASPTPSASVSTTVSPSASASPSSSPSPTAAPSRSRSPSPSAPPTLAPSTAAPTIPPTPTVSPTKPPADLKWTCSPTSFGISAGKPGSSSCDVTSAGYTGGVTFSCDNVPTGLACIPAPGSATLTPGSGANTVFGVSADSSLPPGTYAIEAVVKSDDGTIVRRITLTVTVT